METGKVFYPSKNNNARNYVKDIKYIVEKYINEVTDTNVVL